MHHTVGSTQNSREVPPRKGEENRTVYEQRPSAPAQKRPVFDRRTGRWQHGPTPAETGYGARIPVCRKKCSGGVGRRTKCIAGQAPMLACRILVEEEAIHS